MIRFLVKRCLLMIPVLLGVLIIVFVLSRAMPGNPAADMLGTNYTQEELEAKEREMGLDKPYVVQFFNYLADVVIRFDLGDSYKTGREVTEEISGRMWITIRLGIMSCIFTAIVGISLGVVAATHQNRIADRIVTAGAILLGSMPGFWLSLMSIILFSQILQWLPASGLASWQSYILPVVCNGLMSTAMTTRMTRSSMLEVIRQDYVSTARSKGVKEGIITLHHVLRNALIPIITVIGNQFVMVIGGAVVIESVFSIPGMGTLLVSSITGRDYPLMMGITFVISIFVCLVNTVVDIIYCIADPRMKVQLISGNRKSKRQIIQEALEEGDEA